MFFDTEWDLILEKWGYNTNAIAHFIKDTVGLKRGHNVGTIRVEIESNRTSAFKTSVKPLLSLPSKDVEQYTKQHPSLLCGLDIGIETTALIKVLENDKSISKETISALLHQDEQLGILVELIFKRLGGNTAWIKLLREQ